MWNFFAMQIMFGLIGFEFDITHVGASFYVNVFFSSQAT